MKDEHRILFESLKIGSCRLKNRYVMVAMGNGGMVTSDNLFNDRGIEYYVTRAKGGVGMIITGTLYAENEIECAKDGTMPCPTSNPNAFIMNTAEMCERVHAYDSKIFAQVTAGFGRVIKPHLLLKQPVSASAIPSYWDKSLMCRELSKDEIQKIVSMCGETARICKEAGFDGVEIHAVHEGYLLDQFALSLFNKRNDEYGGDLHGRLKFATDIVKCIKCECGMDFPVIMRFSLKSYIKGLCQGGLPCEKFKELGRDVGEGCEAAKILAGAGYDALDVDAGTYDSWYWSHPPMYFDKGMNIPFGEMLKKNIDVPVIVAGRMENPDLASNAIASQKTDLIGLGRALLADPDVVNKIRAGRYEYVRPCLGCHEGCMNRLITKKPVSCAVNPVVGRESSYELKQCQHKKRVVIIGGGVAGLESARVLALRGHSVTLVEKRDKLGGSLKIAGAPSFKEDDLRLIHWYELTLKELGVAVLLNTEMTKDLLRKISHDVIVVASGSHYRKMEIPGDNKLFPAQDILSGKVNPGDNIAIIGGGLVGCELALDMAKQGKHVSVLEALPAILSSGPQIPHMNKIMLKDLLRFYKVDIYEEASVDRIDGHEIQFHIREERHVISSDSIAYAIGYISENSLYQELSKIEPEIYLLGDARRVRNIMYAIWDAYEVASNI